MDSLSKRTLPQVERLTRAYPAAKSQMYDQAGPGKAEVRAELHQGANKKEEEDKRRQAPAATTHLFNRQRYLLLVLFVED